MIAWSLRQLKSLKTFFSKNWKRYIVNSQSVNQLRQILYWNKGHFDFTSLLNSNSIGWVNSEIQTFEFFDVLTHTRMRHANISIRKFFLNYFSRRFTPFSVFWHVNLIFFFFFYENKASFMRKQKEYIFAFNFFTVFLLMFQELTKNFVYKNKNWN